MAEGTLRGPLIVASLVLAVSGAALVVAATTGSWNPTPLARAKATPVTIGGLPPSKIYVDLNLDWPNAPSKLTPDEAKASRVTGLFGCTTNPPDTSSVPAPPGFSCMASNSFSSASLASLERLPAVQDIGASTARRHYESLYSLGVQRGNWAIITQPVDLNPSNVHAVITELRRTQGVLRCGLGQGGPFLEDEIACSTVSHVAALHTQKVARHFNVGYAEVLRW